MSEYQGEAWTQQPGETSRAYEAFRAYRDLGPGRTLSRVPGRSGSISGWSGRYGWADRVRLWDAELYRIEDERRRDELREMNDQHKQIGRQMQAVGLAALRTFAASDEMTPAQAARLIVDGARIQREALTGKGVPELDTPAEVGDEPSPLERIAREIVGA